MHRRFSIAYLTGLASGVLIAGAIATIAVAQVPPPAPAGHPNITYRPVATDDQRITALQQQLSSMQDQIAVLQQKVAALPAPSSILTSTGYANLSCASGPIAPNQIIQFARNNIVTMGPANSYPDGTVLFSYSGCRQK